MVGGATAWIGGTGTGNPPTPPGQKILLYKDKRKIAFVLRRRGGALIKYVLAVVAAGRGDAEGLVEKEGERETKESGTATEDESA